MRFAPAAAILAGCLLACPPVRAGKFLPDDPLREDNDRVVDVVEEPAELELSDLYDRFSHIFTDVGTTEIGSEAENVNTLDEVPDSSWFTNRHGARRLTVEELVAGPNRGNHPDPDETWEVFRSKSQGLTPGFQIKDERGERYVVKLDPVGIPELSSAAEVVATKIFYAIGYNVPENHIVRIDPGKFTIKPGTVIKDQFGDSVPLTDELLRRLLRRVPRLPDGRIRVTASKYIPGKPIGPFRYYGTRADDPNDVILHEQRRELRGLRLFAAWVNHDDTRAHNTQGSWVEEGGKHYVRHFLIDFGSTFGSGSVDLQLPNLSYHYWMDLDLIKKNLWGFGLHVPKYRKVQWPSFPRFAAVGRWEAVHFDPEAWKNDYPNPAFVRMTPRDAFWAAKIIMRFTPEELLAIVKAGEYSDPRQEDYFYYVLLERQRLCGRFGINGVNPLDEFAIEGDVLSFTNLSEKYSFVGAGSTRYQVSWSVYDNDTGAVRAITEPREQETTRLPLPHRDSRERPSHLYLRAGIRSLQDGFPSWEKPVHVYLRPSGDGWQIVGIERET